VSIKQDFIRGNPRIEIISHHGRPVEIPQAWRPVLGDTDILVAIPDMHMYHYDSNLDNFRYGAETMQDFLQHLQGLKQNLAGHGRRMQVAQLGDMFELRFPGYNKKPISVDQIADSHPTYRSILQTLWSLDPILIYGNHDLKHDAYKESHFSARVGSVYLEHGYGADNWYNFSNPGKRLFGAGMFFFRNFRRVEANICRLALATGYLRKDQFFAAGICSGEQTRGNITDYAQYQHRQLRHFRKVYREFEDYQRPRIIIGAHTHRPYLDPHFGKGKSIFVDAGAFTDGRSDFAVVTHEEVAICRYRRQPVATRVAVTREHRRVAPTTATEPVMAAYDARMTSES
jgi:hypothetical protein